jgi:hypothetical protein
MDNNKVAKLAQQFLDGSPPPVDSEATKQVLDFAKTLETIGNLVADPDQVDVVAQLNVRNGRVVGARVKCAIPLPEHLRFNSEEILATLASCVAEEAGYGRVTAILHGNKVAHLTTEFSFSFK